MHRNNIPIRVHTMLVERLGGETADKFCRAFGGREIYIPARPTKASRLTVVMGQGAADVIAELFGRGSLVVPLGRFSTEHRRRVMVLGMLRAGHSNRKIAEVAGCHMRTVTRITASLRKQGRLL